MIEKSSDFSIKCLTTDRGGEFNSEDFVNFCKDNEIQRQLTNAYTPQQNGVTKHKNRTIMNLVRAMLSAKGVPKLFWAEAANWAIYVLNRSPTQTLDYVTPE